ncbi:hypothetical protein CPB83DRAFT_216538 [Crepidotus variabilis]|uniref:Uncharacterized protein n=1 Tax=Crepidotus variabilis TaxID=179855 RepID=A0A9P6JW89_9AGAR|nr:hypothetical protein CPB83DRAFT_216538 [Crepidotus variabilis]
MGPPKMALSVLSCSTHVNCLYLCSLKRQRHSLSTSRLLRGLHDFSFPKHKGHLLPRPLRLMNIPALLSKIIRKKHSMAVPTLVLLRYERQVQEVSLKSY